LAAIFAAFFLMASRLGAAPAASAGAAAATARPARAPAPHAANGREGTVALDLARSAPADAD
jgi:hypothetical protein